jgi:hypothetical protein
MSGKNGPGKYDPECSGVLVHTQAECVLLLVVRGDRGSGFAVACTNEALLPFLPRMLRELADSCEGADN